MMKSNLASPDTAVEVNLGNDSLADTTLATTVFSKSDLNSDKRILRFGKIGLHGRPRIATCSFDEFKYFFFNSLQKDKQYEENKLQTSQIPQSLANIRAKHLNKWIPFSDWIFSLSGNASNKTFYFEVQEFFSLMSKEDLPKHDRIWPHSKGPMKKCKVFIQVSGQQTCIKWKSREAAIAPDSFFQVSIYRIEFTAWIPIASEILSQSRKNCPPMDINETDKDESDSESDVESVLGQYDIDKVELAKDVFNACQEKGLVTNVEFEYPIDQNDQGKLVFNLPSGYQLNSYEIPEFLYKVFCRN